jgi:protein-L-isoaspartate(D-aspartate) O-methyltransferase
MTPDGRDYGERRTRMVEEQLRARGLTDPDVLAAMRSVPRHLFVSESQQAEAYLDSPLPIGYGQTISQPYMVAIMTRELAVDVRSRVLEVGAGSGYQSAVLAELAGTVFALERLAPLAERARRVLDRLGYQNVRLAIGDGTRGWPEMGPFDGILVAAATREAPAPLLEQLAEGGRLVIPIGRPHGDQVLTVIRRTGDEFTERHGTRCRFVPLIADTASAEERRGGETAPAWAPSAGAGGEVAEMKAVDVRVHGSVQGVFFRATARSEGARLGLRGWVTNESDGSVTLRLQGDAAVVDAMLDWCRRGPPAARVDWLEVADAEADPALSGFEVR